MVQISNPSFSTTQEQDAYLAVLPPTMRDWVAGILEQGPEASSEQERPLLVEVSLDYGAQPRILLSNDVELYLDGPFVSMADIEALCEKVGDFSSDNRAGIPQSLHRVSVVRNRRDVAIGVTMRYGRAIPGLFTQLKDIFEDCLSVLVLGQAGSGKTTVLREASGYLSEIFGRRMIVVDTSGELGGDGDIPHPCLRRALRMQVKSPEQQKDVMIQAVQNQTPLGVCVDEIGDRWEALAANTIRNRGPFLLASAHGESLRRLAFNDELCRLTGGRGDSTVGDKFMMRNGLTSKQLPGRTAEPVFDVCIQLVNRHTALVYRDVKAAVDAIYGGRENQLEVEVRTDQPLILVKEVTSGTKLPLGQLQEIYKRQRRVA